MELVIFHGPGSAGMSQAVSTLKKNFDPLSIEEIGSAQASLGRLKQELLSSPLFSEKRLLIVDNPEEVDLDAFPQVDNLTVLLRFNNLLRDNSKILKQALSRKARVVSFPEEKESSIFPFLDLLAEKNPAAFKSFDKLYNQYGSQYLLTMLIYTLRKFILTPKMPDFARRRYEIQRKNFPVDKIKSLYRKILETDFKIKSGLIEEKIGLTLLAEKFLH